MGIVKSVQPYWRLAIITMQTMPIISWLQRFASETRSAACSVCEIVVIRKLLAVACRVGVRRTGQSRPRGFNARNFVQVPGNSHYASKQIRVAECQLWSEEDMCSEKIRLAMGQ